MLGCRLYPSKSLVFIRVSEKTTYNQHTFYYQIVSCTLNPCNNLNNNIIDHLQPTTMQQTRKLFRFYPTEANTTENPLGVSDEAVEAMRTKPIGQRLVSCFVRILVDGADYNGDWLPLGALLNANSPQVEALRIEPSWIEKKRMEDELPIFTPCCVLQCIPETRTYYPINYTCLLDFDILQDDNPTISLDADMWLTSLLDDNRPVLKIFGSISVSLSIALIKKSLAVFSSPNNIWSRHIMSTF